MVIDSDFDGVSELDRLLDLDLLCLDKLSLNSAVIVCDDDFETERDADFSEDPVLVPVRSPEGETVWSLETLSELVVLGLLVGERAVLDRDGESVHELSGDSVSVSVSEASALPDVVFESSCVFEIERVCEGRVIEIDSEALTETVMVGVMYV